MTTPGEVDPPAGDDALADEVAGPALDALLSVDATGFEGESLSVSDADAADWPLIYATDGFFALTGWRREDILGRNCRVLQGRFLAENAAQRAVLRGALRDERPVRAVLRNERPDGTDYWNEVRLIPLRVGDRRLVLGLQRDLTGYLRAAEQARAAASERFATLDALGDAVFLLQHGRIVYANPIAQRLLGAIRPEQLLGEPLETFIAPDRIRQAQVHYGRVDALARIEPYEITCRRLDGSRFTAELTVTHAPFGDAPAVQILMRDASARVFARGLLEHEKAALTLIAQGAPLAQTLDALCRAVERRLPGAACSVEMLAASGRHLQVVAAPSLPAALVREIDGSEIGPQAASCGTAMALDRTVIASDVQIDDRWTNYRELARAHGIRACWAQPFHHRDGRVAGTFAVYYRHVRHPLAHELQLLESTGQLAEIAVQQHAMRDALGKSEQQRSVLFETVDTGIVMLDAWGRVLDANPTASALLAGLADGAPVRHANFPVLLAQAAGEAIAPAAARDWLAGRVDRLLGVRSPDGAPRWLRLHVARLPDASDAQPDRAHFVATLAELTDIVNAKRELERVDALKDEFLAMLGHELRNPLAPVANAVQILRRAPDHPALRANSIAIIERQVAHLTRLVDDLLEVARIQQGRIHLQRAPVAIGALVATTVETLRPGIEARGHALALQAPPAPAWVLADATRLTQVFTNLLANAAKYTPPGGRIDVRVTVEAGRAEVAIQDTGVGITAELLPHVFDLFTQADRSLARAEGGLGIGLALVRRLVQLHDGSVRVVSPGPGQGATFTVCLPCCAAPAVGEPAAPPVTEAASLRVADDTPVPPRHLLLVGEAPHWAESIADLLAADGHAVTLVPPDGLTDRTAGARDFDVVAVDAGPLPADGAPGPPRARRDAVAPGAAWIAVGPHARASDRQLLGAAGFDHVLVAPVSYAQFRACLAGLRPVTP